MAWHGVGAQVLLAQTFPMLRCTGFQSTLVIICSASASASTSTSTCTGGVRVSVTDGAELGHQTNNQAQSFHLSTRQAAEQLFVAGRGREEGKRILTLLILLGGVVRRGFEWGGGVGRYCWLVLPGILLVEEVTRSSHCYPGLPMLPGLCHISGSQHVLRHTDKRLYYT